MFFKIESNFLPINPKVHISPTQLSFGPPPFPLSSDEVDFIAGLKTIGGNDEPTAREGLALHFYVANADMKNKAFCNSDGDMLVAPQQGRLDVQTEFGRCVVSTEGSTSSQSG